MHHGNAAPPDHYPFVLRVFVEESTEMPDASIMAPDGVPGAQPVDRSPRFTELGTAADAGDARLARLQAALADAARAYRVLMEDVEDAVIVTEADGLILDGNLRACELLGYERGELLAKRPSEIHSTEVAALRAFGRRVLQEGGGWTDELSCEGRLGERIPCEISASRLVLGGRPWMLAMVRDVRDRRRAEAALRQAEQRYRDLYEQAPYAYMSTGADGNIRMVNRRTEELLAYSREELVGRPVQDLYHPDSPSGRPKAGQLFQRFLAGEELREEELELRGADGRSVWVSLSVAPIRDQHGNVVASRDTLEDITARKQAQEALARTLEELQQANAELTHLAYGAAHERSSRVRTIAGFTQRLARRYEGQLGPEADEYLEFIGDAVTRLRGLLDGLQAYAEAGRQEPDVAIVDVGEVVDEVRRSLGAAIEESGASVTTDALPQVRADRNGLAQVLQNLVANAIRHVEPGRSPVIHLSAERDREGWRLSVEDQGPGVPPEQQERVFDAFHRGQRRGTHRGLGIGLAICRKIVENHGGRIWIDTVPGKGSTFAFTIPDHPPVQAGARAR